MPLFLVRQQRHAVRPGEKAPASGVTPLHPVWAFALLRLPPGPTDHAALRIRFDHGQNHHLRLHFRHPVHSHHREDVPHQPGCHVVGEVRCHLLPSEARRHCNLQGDAWRHRRHVDRGLFGLFHAALSVFQPRQQKPHRSAGLQEKDGISTAGLRDCEPSFHSRKFRPGHRYYHLHLHRYHGGREVRLFLRSQGQSGTSNRDPARTPTVPVPHLHPV